MVMEESAMHPHHDSHSPSGGDAPNANSNTNVYLVGLEFVRQYYTVLNQGPLYLHRFYSDDSSFVHGASARDSKVAYGQQEIHKRIQSLNFHNCHAKIRQVDSHETLGNGVVIQVTGELSNNGQPMRRFMQTFVLAPQSPKRYYVRNDIFHYQDEVFADDESELDDVSGQPGLENEENEDTDHEPIPTVEMNGGNDLITSTVEVSVKTSPSPRTVTTPKAVEDEPLEPVDNVVTVSAEGPGPMEVGGGSTTTTSTLSPAHEEEPVVITGSAAANNQPKTFANLFKVPGPVTSGNTNMNKPPVSATGPSGPPPQNRRGGPNNNGPRAGSPGNQHQQSSSTFDNTTSPPQVSPPSGKGGLPPRGNTRGPNNREGGRDHRRERLTSRSSTTLNDETGSVDGDRRRPVHTYPDANQLFVGNLPHFVSQKDIQDIFQPFGEIAEVKIQKPNPKQGNVKVPYFCFVVFEHAESAQAAIDKKSEIFMKMTGGGQRRLNVEPKRSQRSGRDDGPREHEAPYNRTDSSSPAGGHRQNDGMGGPGRGSRTFRGSNRGGGGGQQGGSGGGRGGGNNNMNAGGRGGGMSGRGGHKP